MKTVAVCSLFLVLILSSGSAFGQRVGQYRALPFNATWSTIDTITGVKLTYTDPDVGFATFAMPFTFRYDSSDVAGGTRVTVSANGAMSLTPGITDPDHSVAGDSNYPGSICIFSGDLVSGDNGVNWDAYKVDGTAPNRVLTVQYHGVHFSGAGGTPPKTMMQYKLYETSGIIEFMYLNHSFSLGAVGPTAGVGLNGFRPFDFSKNIYVSAIALTPATDIRWIPNTLVVTGPRIDTVISASKGSQCVIDTIHNIGLTDVTITSLSYSGAGYGNLQVPLTIPVGGAQPMVLCAGNRAPGTFNDSVYFGWSYYNYPVADTFSIAVTNVNGCVSIGPQVLVLGGGSGTKIGRIDTGCITVSNCGVSPATYVPVLDHRFDTTVTKIGDWTTKTILPGEMRTLCVRYAPDSLHFARATIFISQGDTIPVQRIPVNAFGVGVDIRDYSKAVSTKIGTADTITDTIANLGNTTWHAGVPTVQSLDNAFHFIDLVSANVAAGDTAIMRVEFRPVKTGTQTATVTFPSADPVPIGGLPILLHGKGVAVPPPVSVKIESEESGYVLGAAYPNPTNGVANVLITTPRASNVTIVLMDDRGSIVAQPYSGTLAKGEHLVSLNLGALPAGTYYYVLTSGDVRLARQIVK